MKMLDKKTSRIHNKPMNITYRFLNEANPEIKGLIERLDAELTERLGKAQNAYDAHNGLADIEWFCLASRNGTALGCGALKRHSPGVYEVKRVYVDRSFRREGVAQALMERLIDKARSLGATELVLETNRDFASALGLYRKLGFRPIDRYGPYADREESVCLAKALAGDAPLIRVMKTQLDLSLNMVKSAIDSCPYGLWGAKAGGFVLWQQILHALCGTLFWMRGSSGEFDEPFRDREVYPEFERDPVGTVTKGEMRALAERTSALTEAFFAGKDDVWLLAPSAIYDKRTNAEVALGQIRHLMYHAGHFDCALRERGLTAVPWEE